MEGGPQCCFLLRECHPSFPSHPLQFLFPVSNLSCSLLRHASASYSFRSLHVKPPHHCRDSDDVRSASATMSSVFCCCAAHTHSPSDREDARPGALLPSAVTDTPSRRNVPSKDAQALYELFETPCSVSGQRAGAATTTAGPRRSRLEALGHSIQTRLSETRLSKHSSKTSLDQPPFRPRPPKPVSEEDALLVRSTKPRGLDDLLASCTVSEGGYDSDAKAIPTPQWVPPSHTGTIRASPELVTQALQSVEHGTGTPNTRFLTQPDPLPEDEPSSTSCRESVAVSSGPATPPRSSFRSLLGCGGDETTSNVFRRLGLGVAHGTATLPDTANVKAFSIPNVVEAEQDGSLPRSAFKRARSFSQAGYDANEGIKTVRGRGDNTRMETARPAIEEQRRSHVTNLDPALLDHLRHFSDKDSSLTEHSVTCRADTCSHPNETSFVGPSRIAGSGLAGATTTSCTEGVSRHGPKRLTVSASEHDTSDEASAHLCDMCISQTLASETAKPNSPASTHQLDLSSNKATGEAPSSHSLGAGRFARPVSRIHTVTEHLRRPSDPETRLLFESGDAYLWNLHPKWKTATSVKSSHADIIAVRRRDQGDQGVTRDYASSCYMSDVNQPTSRAASLSSVPRSSSIRNTNSLAIGGRQESYIQPQEITSLGRVSSMQWFRSDKSKSLPHSEDNWALGQADEHRHRQEAEKKESRYSAEKVDSTAPKSLEAPTTRKGWACTEANEKMSEVSTGEALINTHERMSEVRVSAALLHDAERMSEISFSRVHRVASTGSRPGVDSTRSIDDSVRAHGETTRAGSRTMRQAPSAESKRPCGHSRSESASSIWERALKTVCQDQALNLGEQPARSAFLAPDWTARGRAGRSRSVGDVILPAREDPSTSPTHARYISNSGSSFSIDDHQRICAAARAPLPRAPDGTQSKSASVSTLSNKPRPKKSSLLDIRSAVPVREFLSWARYPSHNRHERTGPADQRDGVLVRDFSPSSTAASAVQSRSQLSLMAHTNLSTVDLGLRTPASWRILASRSRGKKSRSLPLSRTTWKKPQQRTKMGMLWGWRQAYRNHSSDALRWRAGRPSSISKGVSSLEFPELEIIPGYHSTALGNRRSLHGLDEQVRGSTTTPRPCTPTPAPRRSKDSSRSKMTGPITGAVEGGQRAEDWSRMYEAYLDEMPKSPSEVRMMDTMDAVGHVGGEKHGHGNGRPGSVTLSSGSWWGEEQQQQAPEDRVASSGQLGDSMVGVRRGLGEEGETEKEKAGTGLLVAIEAATPTEKEEDGRDTADGTENREEGEDDDDDDDDMHVPGRYVD